MKRDQFKQKTAEKAIKRLLGEGAECSIITETFGPAGRHYYTIVARNRLPEMTLYSRGLLSDDLGEAVKNAADSFAEDLESIKYIKTQGDKIDAIGFAMEQMERRDGFENPGEKDFLPGDDETIKALAETCTTLEKLLRETEKINIAQHRKEMWKDLLGEKI